MYITRGGEQLYMQITAGKQHHRDIILAMYTFIMSRFEDFVKKNIGLTNCTQ